MSNISTLYFSDKNKHSTLAQKVKWVMDIRGDALDKEGHDITCHGWPVTLAEHTGANSGELLFNSMRVEKSWQYKLQ